VRESKWSRSKRPCGAFGASDSAEGFLAHFIAGPAVARRVGALPEVERNTDDNTLLEFALSPAVWAVRAASVRRISTAWLGKLGAARPDITGDVDWVRVAEEQLAMFASDGYAPPVPPGLTEAAQARCAIRRLVQENKVPDAGRCGWKNDRRRSIPATS
jgi:hypothetical protein